MREIKNNNPEIGKFQKAELKTEKVEKCEPSFCAEMEEAIVKDFSNPSEILGRSQVNSVDNLKEDISFCMAHPKAVEQSEKLFNLALAKLQAEGNPNAYEIASSIATSPEAKELFTK